MRDIYPLRRGIDSLLQSSRHIWRRVAPTSTANGAASETQGLTRRPQPWTGKLLSGMRR